MALLRHKTSDEVRRSLEGPRVRDSDTRHTSEEVDNIIEQSDTEPNGANSDETTSSRSHSQAHSHTQGRSRSHSHTSRESSAMLPSSTHPGQDPDESDTPPSEPPEKLEPSAIYHRLWHQNKGVVLMILAQFFNTVMAVIARLMETTTGDLPPMSPFQMIFARQSITVVLSLLYMWWHKVADAPLGARDVRPWLVMRGFSGFFGLFGLYTSLETLPVSDAVVLTFLAPMLASYLSSCIVKTPFTRRQQVAGFVCIVGVVLITRPVSLFTALAARDPPMPAPAPSHAAPADTVTVATNATRSASASPPSAYARPVSRAIAVCFSLLGVLGTACTFFTISHIGQRAHPLISVNYFSSFCTILSALALVFVPAVPFRLPASAREWLLLALLGASGFVMQFLLTASLAHRKSTLVLNLVYVQMLFALGFDRLLWGEMPGVMSWVGSGLILGSVVWVAVWKEGEKKGGRKGEDEEMAEGGGREEGGRGEEGQGLISRMEGGEEGERGRESGSSEEGGGGRRKRSGDD